MPLPSSLAPSPRSSIEHCLRVVGHLSANGFQSGKDGEPCSEEAVEGTPAARPEGIARPVGIVGEGTSSSRELHVEWGRCSVWFGVLGMGRTAEASPGPAAAVAGTRAAHA